MKVLAVEPTTDTGTLLAGAQFSDAFRVAIDGDRLDARGLIQRERSREATTVRGRQYAFTQTVGKLPLRIQTPSRWHVHRTGAVGQLQPLVIVVIRTSERRLHSGNGPSPDDHVRRVIGLSGHRTRG